jgi:2-oxoisovalerate dehydrogenase E2 component (dihydrolipoyl transacylase)
LSERVFLLPDVGEGLVEAEIVEWKVKVGDVVVLNQPLVDIETAKAVVELPSPFEGTVKTLHGSVGDTMEVGKPLMVIETAADAVADAAPGVAASPAEPAGSEPAAAPRTSVLVGYGVANEDAVATRRHRRRGGPPTPSSPASTSTSTGLISAAPRSTPPVRLYAKQHGIDLATLAGTGRDGLITRDDVERALAGDAPVRPPGPATAGPATRSHFVGRDIESWATGPLEERIPVKGVLKSMSEAMVQSAFSSPHAVVWLRVDATKTVELLDALRQRPNLADVRFSPLTIVALAFCDAARHYPGINSCFDDAANEVVLRRRVNLGIAADTHRGLIVPNIKGADQLDLVSLARRINELVDVARQGTTTPEQMRATTLTITNVGPFAVDGAMAILPPGTGAILAVGQLAKAPWVVDDQVVARHVVELSMSFDHRQIDGALASRVIAHVGAFLTDPAMSIIAG